MVMAGEIPAVGAKEKGHQPEPVPFDVTSG
jgi:hypothetical protein